MKELVKKEESKNWYSKQELATEFGVDPKTIQRIVNEQITLDRPVQTKKGGYHNLETYYDDYLVKLIQAKLLSNQAN